jgi:enamine deaminase RidA (YjgF/YER057c/UK114 family)
MTGKIAARLYELGIDLPEAAPPVATYVPAVRTGNLLFIAGQLPIEKGKPAYIGRVGQDLGIDDAEAAAALCGIGLIAQVNMALDGDLDRVVRVVRLGGYVACVEGFTDQPKVINGASDLMVEVFGDAGRHARAAVGVNSLPLGAAVEVDGIFEVR